jgi:AraC family transcriptional regulator
MDQHFTLDDLAKEVGLSLSSLKRLFIESTNRSAGAFIRRLRMEQAFRSLKNRENSILQTALSAGFDDPSSFARAFKESFGYSPSFARKTLNIVHELDSVSLEEPELVELENFEIQSVTRQGSYFEAAPRAWEELKKHLDMIEFEDDFSGIYIGMGHDNPHEGEVSHDEVRFSAGIALFERDLHIDKTTLSHGSYAKFCYHGKANNLGLAYHYIYGPWSEKANQKIRLDIPAFLMFDRFPDIFEEQTIAIYVPLEKTGNL